MKSLSSLDDLTSHYNEKLNYFLNILAIFKKKKNYCFSTHSQCYGLHLNFVISKQNVLV